MSSKPSKSMNRLLIISLMILVLSTHVGANTTTYNYMYVMNVNDISIGYAIVATTSRIVAVGFHYGAFSSYCGTNEEGVYWMFTYTGEHAGFRTVCFSTYGREYIYDAAADGASVYIAGSMKWIPGSQYDLNNDGIVARISETGQVYWARALGSYTGEEEFVAVAVMDHVYVAGTINNTLAVLKLDKETGSVLWAYTYAIQGYTTRGLAITALSGYIYVLGVATGSSTNNVLLKLDQNGTVVSAWMISGYVYGDITSGEDSLYLSGVALTRISSDGGVIWSRGLNMTAYSVSYRDGYVYLAGSMTSKPVIAKISKNGEPVYAKTLVHNGATYGVSAGQQVYATGYVLVNGYYRMFVLGVTDGFTNEHVVDASIELGNHQVSTQSISIQRTPVQLQQTSSGSSASVNYYPSPLFRTPTTTNPSPSPTLNTTTTTETSITMENPPVQIDSVDKKLVIGAAALILLLILVAKTR